MAIPGGSNDSRVTSASLSLAPAGPWQTATVVKIAAGTPRIKTFFLALSRPFVFQAGQHVDVRLTAPDGYRAMRSYSIASAPQAAATIELAVERLDSGEVSTFLHDVVGVGDSIELRGPLGGYFLWPESDDGSLLLVGGGSGVVPLVSMIRHRRSIDDRRAVLLLYSVRGSNDLLYGDELLDLDRRRDGFTLVIVLTREQPTRPGDYGRRVDAAMMADVIARLQTAPKTVFVCGSNQFVNAAADGAVAAGIPAADIRTERYGV
jgi:ferredoxin-NADP reductase